MLGELIWNIYHGISSAKQLPSYPLISPEFPITSWSFQMKPASLIVNEGTDPLSDNSTQLENVRFVHGFLTSIALSVDLVGVRHRMLRDIYVPLAMHYPIQSIVRDGDSSYAVAL